MTSLGTDDIVAEAGPVREESRGQRRTEPPETPIRLTEHDRSAAFQLSFADIAFLESIGENGAPLSVTHTASETSYIESGSYVGVAALPSGTRIEVNPKETVSRLLDLLQYAMDVPTTTIKTTTEMKQANTFLDAFASLFYAELKAVLNQGIRRDYRRIDAIEDTVRGRLDVQRQIQRSTPIPTDFAVEYDTFTADTTLNQAVLNATQILAALVEDEKLSSKLTHQEMQLRQFVTPTSVSVADLKTVQITRLNKHYEDLIELSRLVLSRRFFEDLTLGDQQTFGLFFNMNTMFETVVERAFTEAVENVKPGWSVDGQGEVGVLITGPHSVSMQPDFVIRNEKDQIRLVGDAKWKTGDVKAGDIYQITSYMLADNAPGLLVYPEQGTDDTPSTVRAKDEALILRSVELPTAAGVASYDLYQNRLVEAAEMILSRMLDSIE